MYPALHRQWLCENAPSTEYELAGHDEIVFDDASRKYPALAVQSSMLVLPSGEFELAGHAEHALFSEYVPAAHSRHTPTLGSIVCRWRPAAHWHWASCDVHLPSAVSFL